MHHHELYIIDRGGGRGRKSSTPRGMELQGLAEQAEAIAAQKAVRS
jgi:hypothetical protein